MLIAALVARTAPASSDVGCFAPRWPEVARGRAGRRHAASYCPALVVSSASSGVFGVGWRRRASGVQGDVERGQKALVSNRTRRPHPRAIRPEQRKMSLILSVKHTSFDGTHFAARNRCQECLSPFIERRLTHRSAVAPDHLACTRKPQLADSSARPVGRRSPRGCSRPWTAG